MRHSMGKSAPHSAWAATVAGNAPARAAKARLAAEAIVFGVLAELARRAQAAGTAKGARLPAGPARRRVELVKITEARGRERRTPIGYRTARVALPHVLASLEETDPRRIAALRYATLVERIGAMPVSTWDAPGGGVRASDGGASWRVAMAQELRRCLACAPEAVIIAPRTKGARRAVTVRAAVDGVCLLGLEVKGVLRAHGWSPWGEPVRQVTDAVLVALSAMAEVQAVLE